MLDDANTRQEMCSYVHSVFRLQMVPPYHSVSFPAKWTWIFYAQCSNSEKGKRKTVKHEHVLQ